jgi:hypothetical protein
MEDLKKCSGDVSTPSSPHRNFTSLFSQLDEGLGLTRDAEAIRNKSSLIQSSHGFEIQHFQSLGMLTWQRPEIRLNSFFQPDWRDVRVQSPANTFLPFWFNPSKDNEVVFSDVTRAHEVQRSPVEGASKIPRMKSTAFT